MEISDSQVEIIKTAFEEGRQTRSMIIESSGTMSPVEDDRIMTKSHSSASLCDYQHHQQEQPVFNPPIDQDTIDEKRIARDMEMMKERFAKMLLGEDMSGGGKGVPSALALSNSITNVAASVFGEQKKLEPMAPETKARWRKEIDWLLSVTDHIVEFAPSQQKAKDGTCMEIMTTRQRSDLHLNIPALRKLDAMLLDVLDEFKDQREFYYPSKEEQESDQEKSPARQDGDKWWIPKPKVPPNGLSESARWWLQNQKDAVNQVLKAAMAINAQVLAAMTIPDSYVEALPKTGRATVGEAIYKSIIDEFFDPDCFLTSIDLSSEHKVVDLKNKLEALVVIWKRKLSAKETRSSWSGISTEKRELYEGRAETVLLLIKQYYPGISQSNLDISKIQYNKDVGLAILESYSRIIESMASTVLSRIDDVINADTLGRTPTSLEQRRLSLKRHSSVKPSDKLHNLAEDSSPTTSLFDVMAQDESDEKNLGKFSDIAAENKLSYIERIGSAGGRSPASRH